MDVLGLYERGDRTADMTHALGLSESTLQTMINSVENVKESAKCGTSECNKDIVCEKFHSGKDGTHAQHMD